MGEIVIKYYNKHEHRFILFFRGSLPHAHEFMQLYGNCHRLYYIEERKVEHE